MSSLIGAIPATPVFLSAIAREAEIVVWFRQDDSPRGVIVEAFDTYYRESGTGDDTWTPGATLEWSQRLAILPAGDPEASYDVKIVAVGRDHKGAYTESEPMIELEIAASATIDDPVEVEAAFYIEESGDGTETLMLEAAWAPAENPEVVDTHLEVEVDEDVFIPIGRGKAAAGGAIMGGLAPGREYQLWARNVSRRGAPSARVNVGAITAPALPVWRPGNDGYLSGMDTDLVRGVAAGALGLALLAGGSSALAYGSIGLNRSSLVDADTHAFKWAIDGVTHGAIYVDNDGRMHLDAEELVLPGEVTASNALTLDGVEPSDPGLDLLAASTFADQREALGSTLEPLVLAATGQSNIFIQLSYTWTVPTNLRVWNGAAWVAPPGTQIGTALAWAAEIARANPLRMVYLVTASYGGVPITYWLEPDDSIYQQLKDGVEDGLAAIGHDRISGLLWWQGESDAESSTYKADWEAVIARLRAEDWFPYETPIAIMGITPYMESPDQPIYAAFNRTLVELAAAEPGFRTYIHTGDLPEAFWDSGDPDYRVHMTADGYAAAGAMAAKGWAAVRKGEGARPTIVDPSDEVTYASELWRFLEGATFGDDNFAFGIVSGAPLITFDALDGMYYNRVTNTYAFSIGFADAMTIASAGVYVAGVINLGHASDTTISRASAGVASVEGAAIMTTSNDGASSGFDADMLDGYHAASFALLSGAAFTGGVSVGDANFAFDIASGAPLITFDAFDGMYFNRATNTYAFGVSLVDVMTVASAGVYVAGVLNLGHASDTTFARVSAGVASIEGAAIMTTSNDGASSGFDADMLDGYHAASFALLSGAAFTGGVSVGDANFAMGMISSTPFLIFDSTDSLGYDRTANRYSFLVASTAAMTVGATSAYLAGTLELGHASDTTISRASAGVASIEGAAIMTTSNDGASSGFDADMLDGYHAASFALLSGATFSGAIAANGGVTVGDANFALGMVSSTPFVIFDSNDNLGYDRTANVYSFLIASTAAFSVGASSAYLAGTLDLGHASDTTLARASAGNVSIEGNLIYRAGGTDVLVADGGTGASSAAAAATNLGLGTGNSPQFTAVNLGHASDTTFARVSAGVASIEGAAIMTTSNDGASSGFDADMLDGYHASSFALLSGATFSGAVAANGGVTVGDANFGLGMISTTPFVIFDSNDNLGYDRTANVYSFLIASTAAFSVGASSAYLAGTLDLGHASDTTLARASAGNVSIEGNLVYRAGGTDVPVADGGTGASSAAAAATNLGLGTGNSPQFTAVNLGHASDTTFARVSAGIASIEGAAIMTTSNDGASSGFDADMLDGYHAASFALLSGATFSGAIAANGGVTVGDANFALGMVSSTPFVIFDSNDNLGYDRTNNRFAFNIASGTAMTVSAAAAYLAGVLDLGHASDTTLSRLSAGVLGVEGSKVMTVANDGAGSLFDADLLDGYEAAAFALLAGAAFTGAVSFHNSANFSASIVSSNPTVTFDSNDTMLYNRSSDLYGFTVGGTSVFAFGAGGAIFGAPSGGFGGFMGPGTVNAKAVYDDGTMVTDLVLDFAVDGRWDRDVYKDHPIANDNAPLAKWWFDIPTYAAFWKRERRLPGMRSWKDPKDKPGHGESTTRLTAVVETQAVHIAQLNERIERLEAQLKRAA